MFLQKTSVGKLQFHQVSYHNRGRSMQVLKLPHVFPKNKEHPITSDGTWPKPSERKVSSQYVLTFEPMSLLGSCPDVTRGWGSEIVVGVVQVAQEMHKGYNKIQPECSTLWADDLTINRQTIAARDIFKRSTNIDWQFWQFDLTSKFNQHATTASSLVHLTTTLMAEVCQGHWVHVLGVEVALPSIKSCKT